METFIFDEKYLSQIPALHLLSSLGFEYLTPEEARAERGGKLSGIILEKVLREQLKASNRIQYKGQAYLFSEENIQSAIERLKSVKYDGLLKTNEAVYDVLTLGVSLEQSVEGDQKSFTLSYIDWNTPGNNKFHVTAEFPLERTRSHETTRPDIVLFVNGIPFAVIECKSPKVEIGQAVSQTIRNQREEYIPRLFSYAQLVIGLNKNAAAYATVGTPTKFWSVWKEEIPDADLRPILDKALPPPTKAALDKLLTDDARIFVDSSAYYLGRIPTLQDRTLYALCRPERLLEMTRLYTVFDAGVRKIARSQQYFAIKKIIRRVKQRDPVGRREGGIIWHTQGSGKSLTMVMLARALAMDPEIRNPRIVLVTDRIDLDKQLGNTFRACGLSPDHAGSSRQLLKLVADDKAHIITTLIHKFDRALAIKNFRENSANIFVLVDESHRTNFGSFAARMRQMFPMACYLGFTGTPLLKKERNNFARFGGLIDAYPMEEAVADGAVVPLLYEARMVEMEQNEKAIDTWFERHTEGLTDPQKADLKRKYSRAEMLNKTDQVAYMRAFDISEHYRQNWQGTGFKAQLVARSKATALKYKQFLDEIGAVTSEVVISAPDMREGYDDIEDAPTDKVVEFWGRMMKRFGSEEEYLKQIINRFKNADAPEILIVVDKLLTGFDAPRNTVLYLTRTLREHSLLQAIARVNRIYDDEFGSRQKDFGYIIDYAGVLGELDQAMTAYEALQGFDENDLRGTLRNVSEEVRKLPQHHADLWDLFKEINNKSDEEAFELLLADEKQRNLFYERLTAFGKTLGIALSSEQFVMSTPARKVQGYKNDLKRFANLRTSVKLRYAEAVDYREFEPKIQKLLDTHITATEVVRLSQPVNIFDEDALKKVIEEQGGKSAAAKADTIAHATKRAISERLEMDPAFYERFSKLIQQAIDDFRAKRISDLEYLKNVSQIKDSVVHRKNDDVPAEIKNDEDASALFRLLKRDLARHGHDGNEMDSVCSQAAANIWAILRRNKKVGFWDDLDAQRRTVNEIDDYLYDQIKEGKGVPLTTELMDGIIEESMRLAKHRIVN
jgi:type I restriction enzyme, R subunit